MTRFYRTSLCTAILMAAAPLSAATLEERVTALESRAGNTQVSIGGFVKADAIYSNYSDGEQATAAIGDDFLVPSTIPVAGTDGDSKLHMIAKQSRFWLKTSTPTDNGTVTGHFEMDFQTNGGGDERISNSETTRLRHAYLSWNNWLFGQTWSTFFNVSALPETLDFVGSSGTVFVRQAQVRYTNGGWMIAAENPSSTLYGGVENPYDDNTVPDVIVRYNMKGDWGNVSLAAMGRQLAHQDVGFREDKAAGYGVALAGQLKVGDRNDIRFQVNQGNALGRYINLNAFRSGVIEADGEIELVDTWSAVLAYRHHWSDRWRTNLAVSASAADNPDTAAVTVNERVRSGHLNLIWQAAKPLTLGGELIYGEREQENGDDGNLRRLQLSAKYAF